MLAGGQAVTSVGVGESTCGDCGYNTESGLLGHLGGGEYSTGHRHVLTPRPSSKRERNPMRHDAGFQNFLFGEIQSMASRDRGPQDTSLGQPWSVPPRQPTLTSTALTRGYIFQKEDHQFGVWGGNIL